MMYLICNLAFLSALMANLISAPLGPSILKQNGDDCFDLSVSYFGFDLDGDNYVSTESASACQIDCQNTAGCLY